MNREEAILLLHDMKDTYDEIHENTNGDIGYEQMTALDMAIKALQDRPQGEWKHTITWQPYCSNCEYVFGEDEEYSPFWKYCPMCGAEMADNSLFNDITESPNDVVESKDDVIKVVRCKDCKYCWYDDYTESLECRHNKGLNEEIYGNDFCCYGERREP